MEANFGTYGRINVWTDNGKTKCNLGTYGRIDVWTDNG